MADGLPSNHIYTCVEDLKGFLWIATEAGIARFDGKTFQVFTTRQGLPDDEVLNVVRENNGRLWVNCFKQSPAYFDDAKNRFVNASEDSGLGRPRGANLIYLSALPKGGVMYNNEKNCFIYENNKFHYYNIPFPGAHSAVTVQRFPDGSYASVLNDPKSLTSYLVRVKENRIVDSVVIARYSRPMDMKYFIGNKKFYLLNEERNGFQVISHITIDPLRCQVKTFDAQTNGHQLTWAQSSAGYFNVITKGGECVVFDEKTDSLVMRFKGNYSPNAMYHDRVGNIWVSSIDKGLYLYKKREIRTMPMEHGFTNSYFLSIARKPDGAILAGNYFGQVAEFKDGQFTLHKLPEEKVSTVWQRKIICSQGKVFTFSEGGSYIDYRERLFLSKDFPISSKTAAALNDSTIVEGSYGLMRYIDSRTGKITPIRGYNKRVTCISVAPGPVIYHGSTDGLYKYVCREAQDIDLTASNPALLERITAVCASTDGLVWVGTSSKGVIVLKNDLVYKRYSMACGMTSNNIKTLAEGRPGEMWVGTGEGISIIRYNEKNADSTCHNLSTCDGLSNNLVNEMLYDNDTMYCATGNGVTAIPAGISIPPFDISVQLTGIQVNNRDTSVSSSYRLSYDQNSLTLKFAGIELGGHFNYFQYRIDQGGWTNLDGNTLDLQLNSGTHLVMVRAVDLNGRYSSIPLRLSFHIDRPLWRSPWFWLLILALIWGMLIWLFRRAESRKREAAVKAMLSQKKMTELELQALKAQINPHFIFNCLNSIKLLNHKQQYSVAEKYMDKFASLLRSALEQSSVQWISLKQEIEFIENYLSLEKLRFPDRLFFTIEKDSSLDLNAVMVPSMLLQPCIENAIRHGIGPVKDRPGIITVRFKKENDILVAEVQDNGKGIDEDEIYDTGRGIGIMNTRRRSLFYNITYKITNLTRIGNGETGTLVRLMIPLDSNNNLNT